MLVIEADSFDETMSLKHYEGGLGATGQWCAMALVLYGLSQLTLYCAPCKAASVLTLSVWGIDDIIVRDITTNPIEQT